MLRASPSDFVATTLYDTLLEVAFVRLRGASDNLEAITDMITEYLDDGDFFDPG